MTPKAKKGKKPVAKKLEAKTLPLHKPLSRGR